MNKLLIFSCLAAIVALPCSGQEKKQKDSTTPDIEQVCYAWKILPPLGLREPASMDTVLYNYAQKSVPSAVSPAYATTGNLGAAGETLLYFDRAPMSQFMFQDALSAWLPSLATEKFYNTRIPMTLLSYNNSGGRENAQDRLNMVFSGNINKKAQVGALFDYLYSKGSYDYQATKGLTWGASGSYIGDRYEMQAFYNHWNTLGKENGGITNDLYITDPAELQGGVTSIQAKSIPTRLTGAFNKIVGSQLYVNNIYKVGFWKEEEVDDSTTVKTYVPVSSFTWTLEYKNGKHIFRDHVQGDMSFWKDTYLNASATDDNTSYWSLSNTVGVSLLEEFNKFARFSLSAFATYEIRNFKQVADTIDRSVALPDGLTAYNGQAIPATGKENLLWVGGQLTKQMGTHITYDATARFGMLGSVVGDINLEGNISTKFKLFGDSVTISGYGNFRNEEAPYFTKHYVSNHFMWENDFGKIRTLRLGGKLNIPHTGSFINVGVENVQNCVYFNADCLPTQYGGSVQVLSASLNQNFKFGNLHWDNRVTYQTSSQDEVIPLPKLSVYTNLYLLFSVANALHVQLGVDCDYYTKYKAVDYQPATMTFYNQREIECGNYPFMNAYANMKLSKVVFYVMFSHVNQGLTGYNYFSMPHYPLNPRRFQMGLSINFAN